MVIFSRQTHLRSSIIVPMFNKKWVSVGYVVMAALLFVLPNQLYAKTDAEIEEAIRGVISERHPKDTADWWHALGPSTPKIILAMYEKSSQTYTKLRLIEALAWFSDDAASVEFLKQEADQTEEDVLRNAAVKSVGVSQGSKETEFVSKYLHHSDLQTRLVAAQTLQGIAQNSKSDARAKAVLDQYMREEKTPWILDRLNGKFSEAKGPLVIVSSSEDRVASVFPGIWKGFWIFPRVGKPGLFSTPATLRLELKSAGVLKGEFVMVAKKQVAQQAQALSQIFVLNDPKAKGKTFSGGVSQEIFRPGGKMGSQKEGVSFQGEISESDGFIFLNLRTARGGGSFILRKE